MRLFLAQIAAFLPFATAVVVCLLVIWGELVPVKLRPNLLHPAQVYGYLDTRLKEADASPPVDVLFLGSSKAYRGFDPRIWAGRGFRAFNLGSTGQTPLQMEVLVQRYADRLKPRLVIIEVDASPFMDEGVEASLDFFANGPVDRPALEMAWRLGHLKTWNAVGFGLWLECTGRRNPRPEPPSMGTDTYVPGGFVEHESGPFEPPSNPPAITIRLRRAQVEAFHRTLRALDVADVPYVLVSAPVTDALYRSRRGQDELTTMLQGCGRYMAMQDPATYDDRTHFYDLGHLNQRGVERFNTALIDCLERRGWLPGTGLR
ncbi:MAG: hypothetical protein IPM46_00600 [Flavobacteriales bacterium]|nr:hypothetical protein [Flavobacteriales bacterium]